MFSGEDVEGNCYGVICFTNGYVPGRTEGRDLILHTGRCLNPRLPEYEESVNHSTAFSGYRVLYISSGFP